LWERCTWELDFVVARRLGESGKEISEEETRRKEKGKGRQKPDLSDGGGEGEDEAEGEQGRAIVVACSGELVEHICHPFNSTQSIFRFVQSIPTSVQHVTFAVGPFHVLTIPASPPSSSQPNPSSNPSAPSDSLAKDAVDPLSSDDSQPLIHAFCLPSYSHNASSALDTLRTSTSFIRSAMDFYSTEFGSYPFSTFNLVFVDAPVSTSSAGAGMALLDADLLHPREIIDQAYETRHVLSHALAFQWVGINIIPKSWADTWLVNGLSLYLTGLFLRRMLGNNEYRFRLKKDTNQCAALDDGSQLPICVPGSPDPPDAAALPFINLKAALVLHILDRRLGKTGTSLGLSRVIPKIFLSAITGELANNALSTQAFLRMCRKVSGVDMRSFAEQWIWGSGVPSLDVTAYFNKKKMLIEMTVRQKCPARERWADDPVMLNYYKPSKMFDVSSLFSISHLCRLDREGADPFRSVSCDPSLFPSPPPLSLSLLLSQGQMTVRIHEADGTPYEHVLDIREGFKTYDVPFNTKYKRVRRNTKRYLARKAAAAAAAAGDADAAEAMGMLDLGFDLTIWEDEREREKWRVADWTEGEEETMVGAPYEWIRLDADFEWVANVRFDQEKFYWVSQLQRDRDVVAQLEVCWLKSLPFPSLHPSSQH
jgi:transcription initiation factor TFIID subunit 2